MKYAGAFRATDGALISVEITTPETGADVEIGTDGLYFAADGAVTVEAEANGALDVLRPHSARVALLTRSFMPGFFAADCRDVSVRVSRGGKCVFSGYVEPQTYSQNYNEVTDELELNCIDRLSALQYRPYGNRRDYNTLRTGARQRSFADIIGALLPGETVRYDGSRSMGGDPCDIFGRIGVSELLFLGSEEDDVWTCDKVLEAILRYLNLHIEQRGDVFYIYSRDSVSPAGAITWYDLGSGQAVGEGAAVGVTDITAAMATGTDTQISIGEVYSRVELTCNLQSVENLIQSPLDEDMLEPLYSRKQLYCSELQCEFDKGERDDAAYAFAALVRNTDKLPVYKKGRVTDWYLWQKSCKNWVFPTLLTDHPGQCGVANAFGAGINCRLFALGSDVRKIDGQDNAVRGAVSMKDYLVISVNGAEAASEHAHIPTDETLLQSAPVAVYNGPSSGAVYSPADDATVNYIVLSGKIALVPRVQMSGYYPELLEKNQAHIDITGSTIYIPYPGEIVPGRDTDRFYTVKYWHADAPEDTPVYDPLAPLYKGLVPYSDRVPELMEFKYSDKGEATDKISKVAVLACMLVIGDKVCVETGTAGDPADFEWRKYKERSECADDDEYYSQCIYIGFDPKIGDHFIGTEFDVRNNITDALNIDARGTAIPIRRSDGLSGAVRFSILGPVNTLWKDWHRRHKTWFRSEKWTSGTQSLLGNTSAIFISDFEVKVYSDNGGDPDNGDSDLVYVSDTDESYVNVYSAEDFDITSALTTEERRQLGVNDTLSLSTAIDLGSAHGVLAVTDTNAGETAKPEQLYVDSVYTEYHRPRIELAQSVTIDEADPLRLYRHPGLPGRLFRPLGISYDLQAGSARLNLKEI